MLHQNIQLIIERDNCLRVVRRIENMDGYVIMKSYLYNDYGDLIKVNMTQNDVTFLEENYHYEYDNYKNKTKKIRKMLIDASMSTHSSTADYNTTTYHYINEYLEGNLIKKTCWLEDTVLYTNQYYYHEDKLIRIERYNRPPSMELWRTELIDYESNKVINSIHLSNSIISHYIIVSMMDGVPTKYIMNPAKGRYHWEITNFDTSCCSIYIGENKLTADILLEILNHIEMINEKFSEPFMLLIICSDTLVDTSDTKLYEIEMSYMERGISIQYVP